MKLIQLKASVWIAIAANIATSCCVVGRLVDHGSAGKAKGSGDNNGLFVEEQPSSSSSSSSSSAAEPRIVGGQYANIGEFPFYAQWWGSPAGDSSVVVSCGASLIHNDILLTAAHCNKDTVDNVIAVVGAIFPLSVLQGYVRTVTARRIHPNWKEGISFKYDYLILKLNLPVPTPTITVNSLSSTPVNGEQLTVIGLGRTSSGGTSPSSLLKVNYNLINFQTCKNNYQLEPYADLDATVNFCAGVSGGGKGSCQGDSGGPVFNSKGVQVGIVSYAKGCANAAYPSVSARTSGASTWIRQQVCALSAYPPSYCYTTLPSSTSVRLDVAYDNYPSYTSYKIFSGSQAVLSVGAGLSSYKNQIVSKSLTFTPGFYYMQLFDYLGRYLCCLSGVRFVAAFAVVNGLYQQIIPPTYANGVGNYANVSLAVPSSRTRIVSNSATVRVEIGFDAYPTETSFTIYNSAGTAVQTSGLGLSSFAGGAFFWEYTLPAGSYTLRVSDTAGDGNCCTYPDGLGYYAVYAVSNGVYRALVTPKYGVFLSYVNVPFSLSSSTISRSGVTKEAASAVPPSQGSIFASACQDSISTFEYDATVIGGGISSGIDKQTCLWLASKPQWKKSLCQPNQDAYKACPKTCGACVNSCEGQDDTTATFLVDNNATRNCAWLSTHPSYWPSQCVPGKPAYSFCKDVCYSC